MSAAILHLFPDTNLFAQCRPLPELDWERWGTFDEVHLIVCRPVQSEIDQQKGKGNDRLAKRARKTSSMFKDILLSDEGLSVIREVSPRVTLRLEPQLRADESLRDVLNYQEADDCLVGIAYGFAQTHPEADVRVLTHDVGPIASAKTVGVKAAPVPDEWLLAPETTESDKAVKVLRDKIKFLESQEPVMEIAFQDAAKQPAPAFSGELRRYVAFTASERSDLMDRLRARHPMQTNFSSKTAPPNRMSSAAAALGVAFEYAPPDNRDITKYQNDVYPNWLKTCDSWFGLLADRLQARATDDTFTFLARNVGTRPAEDVLVTLRAKGNFLLRAPDDNKRTKDTGFIGLPPPPAPPAGQWLAKTPYRFPSIPSYFTEGLRDFPMPMPRDFASLPEKRDPNAFFWKPRPSGPSAQHVFECEQWRHGEDIEPFWARVVGPEDAEALTGVVECEISAANLSTAVKLVVPVNLVVARRSLIELAHDRIEVAGRTSNVFSDSASPPGRA